MKKAIIIIIVIVCISFICIFTGCNNQINLYEYGIEVTSLIGEMIKDETYLEYLEITSLAKPKPELSPINTFTANDYDEPIRTYSATNPELEKYKSYILQNKKEVFDKLSDEIKKAINQKINIMLSSNNFIFQISSYKYFNEEYSWEDYIIANNTSVIKEFNIRLKEPINYIYVFETGKPIIVNFTPKDKKTTIATGMFFLGDCSSLSSIREELEPFGCTVENL